MAEGRKLNPGVNINCLELMAVIFGLKTFCSRKGTVYNIYIYLNNTIVNWLNAMGGTHFIECNSDAKNI